VQKMQSKVTLNQILKWLELTVCDTDVPVFNLSLDSRTIQKGDVFIALSGFRVHGMDYAYQAERAGAIAVISEPTKEDRVASVGRQKPLGIPVFECDDLSGKLGELASKFYGHPSQYMDITAITGTNGKTSTAWLLMHALEQLGVKTAYIGTLGVGDSVSLEKIPNTTPSAIDIQKHLADMRTKGFEHVCIEVSSHALDQYRFTGTQIENAIFTNLSRDHLDYHRTMKAYAATKLKLFTEFTSSNKVINVDDETGASWVNNELKSLDSLSYGINNKNADFNATDIRLLHQGIAFKLINDNTVFEFQTGLLGQFNVENTLAVIAVLKSIGFSMIQIQSTVAELCPVPGRMNRVDIKPNGSLLVIDYAHTPDALEQVLKALRSHVENQLWCVFGCGGNRDKGKRPMMGSIAEKYADNVILTDDNPRFESSQQILNDIEFGMRTKPHVIANRKQAIAYAIDKSQQGDIILLAGKGHESTQEINGELIHFNDMEVVQELMQVTA